MYSARGFDLGIGPDSHQNTTTSPSYSTCQVKGTYQKVKVAQYEANQQGCISVHGLHYHP